MATRDLLLRIKTEGAPTLNRDMDRAAKSVESLQSELSQLKKRGAEAGDKLDEMGGEADKASRKMNTLAAAAGSLGRILRRGIVIGGGAAITGLGMLTRQVIRAGMETDRLSKITGASTDEIQRLSYAVKQEHGDVSALVPAFRALSRAQMEASRTGKDGKTVQNEYTRALDQLGITLQGKGFTETLLDLADAYQRVGNEQEFMAAAQIVLGRGAADLVPILRQQRSVLAQTMAETPGMMTEAQIKAIKALANEWEKVRHRARDVVVDNFDNMIAILQSLVDAIDNAMPVLIKTAKLATEGVVEIGEIVGGGDTEERARGRAESFRAAAGRSEKAQQAFGEVADIMAGYARPLTEEEKRRAEDIARRDDISLPRWGLTGNMEQSRRQVLIDEDLRRRGYMGPQTSQNVVYNFIGTNIDAGAVAPMVRPYAGGAAVEAR